MASANFKPEPTVLVIFGAGGDLTWRKLIPALYNLFLDGWLGDRFAVIGIDLKPMTDDEFRAHLHRGAQEASRRSPGACDKWQQFSGHLSYLSADFSNPETFTKLGERFALCDKEWNATANHLFYLAISPTL